MTFRDKSKEHRDELGHDTAGAETTHSVHLVKSNASLTELHRETLAKRKAALRVQTSLK